MAAESLGRVGSDLRSRGTNDSRGVLDEAADPFPEIESGSPEIDLLKRHMQRVAQDPHVTVLILGESGTGKERVARAIHRASPRGRAPFVVVNCAGLSPTLVEDELFGHTRGAFTGAIEDRPGPFERANGGTVFLDEVGELTLDLQMKLLRALQQRTVQRLGGRRETPFDVRVIAATNADLVAATMRGGFREDLYYRLKVYELRIPPLRKRGAANLQRLADAILGGLCRRRDRPAARLDRGVWDRLVGYTWPGNVRELENTLERMLVAAGGDRLLMPEHLPDDFGAIGEGTVGRGTLRRVTRPARDPSRKVLDFARPLPSKPEVIAALERCDFNCGRTAITLGLSRHQLYRLFKRYEIAVSRTRISATPALVPGSI